MFEDNDLCNFISPEIDSSEIKNQNNSIGKALLTNSKFLDSLDIKSFKRIDKNLIKDLKEALDVSKNYNTTIEYSFNKIDDTYTDNNSNPCFNNKEKNSFLLQTKKQDVLDFLNDSISINEEEDNLKDNKKEFNLKTRINMNKNSYIKRYLVILFLDILILSILLTKLCQIIEVGLNSKIKAKECSSLIKYEIINLK